MRFVLTYSGPLPPNGGTQDKHHIRRSLLPQLKQQWVIDPALNFITHSPSKATPGTTKLQEIGTTFALGSFHFVPLVMREYNLVCYLEIVMLRNEQPGNVLQSGG